MFEIIQALFIALHKYESIKPKPGTPSFYADLDESVKAFNEVMTVRKAMHRKFVEKFDDWYMSPKRDVFGAYGHYHSMIEV